MPPEATSPVRLEDLGISERVPVRQEEIEAFCQKWQVRELTLFGSVLRDDFRPESDIDVLVEFEAEAQHSLFEFITMQEELEEMFGRTVDLVQKSAVKNPFVRHHIRHNRQVVFHAA
jgi:predicted nucleotidyltransferase